VIRPGVSRFGAGTGHQAKVISLQQPVEAATHRQFERGQCCIKAGGVGR